MRVLRGGLKRIVQLVIAVLYRRVDVVTSHPLTAEGPELLAVNHTNGLADSFVVIAKTPGFPRFLAAASWWKFPPARLLFELGGVLPVHRRREGENTQHNASSFEECQRALADGAQIAIHPEGEMHQELSLLPLRTGAARIALGAVTQYDVRDLTIVPHAIVYADPGRFRSEAALNVGEPIDVAKWADLYETDPETAVRDLTERIAEGMRSVTANYDSAREADLAGRAAAYALADEPDAGYGRRHAVARALGDAFRSAGGESSTEFGALEEAVETHAADLRALGVTPARGAPRLTPRPQPERRRDAVALAALTPAAVAGIVTSAPIPLIVTAASRRVRGEGWQATTKAAVGFLACPVVWGAEALAVAHAGGRRRALAVALVAPVGALAWIAWSARWLRARHDRRLARAARDAAPALAAAQASRAEVRGQVEALVGDRFGTLATST